MSRLLDAASRAAGRAARDAARRGATGPTSGLAPGLVQANLIALPRDWAYDMLLFAQRNPKPCPVLEVIDEREPDGRVASTLACDADLRTDLPRYRVWEHGVLADEPTDARAAWGRHDLVAFLIGCSFTFESSLASAGIEVRHQTLGRNVPMYRTSRECVPAGRLEGQLVVSMRPIPADRVADAVTLSARYPAVHGAPIHVGDPTTLVIAELDAPDFGDPPVVHPGEVPVFWACGVTPQAAVMRSRPPFAITHAPGSMFVTDVPNESYAV